MDPIFKGVSKKGIKSGELKLQFEVDRARDFYLYPDPDGPFSAGKHLSNFFKFFLNFRNFYLGLQNN